MANHLKACLEIPLGTDIETLKRCVEEAKESRFESLKAEGLDLSNRLIEDEDNENE